MPTRVAVQSSESIQHRHQRTVNGQLYSISEHVTTTTDGRGILVKKTVTVKSIDGQTLTETALEKDGRVVKQADDVQDDAYRRDFNQRWAAAMTG